MSAAVATSAVTLFGFLAFCGPGAAQESRAASTPQDAVIAVDHLELKGLTAWILDDGDGSRRLVVARVGAAPRVRVVGAALFDVIFDPTGRHLVVAVARGRGVGLDRLSVHGDEVPLAIVENLGVERVVLHRAGSEVLAASADGFVAIDAEGAVRRHQGDATAGAPRSFARNASGTMTAVVRGGRVALEALGGDARYDVGWGADPAFVSDAALVYVLHGDDFVRSDPGAAVIYLDLSAADPEPVAILSLDGVIGGLRAAADGCVLLRHAPAGGRGAPWLLHVGSGVIRPMGPRDFGALRAALDASSRPTSAPLPAGPEDALPEPELETSGFFFVNESGVEVRTAFEESGFDELKHPGEAAIFRRLLDRFLDGVQWPMRHEGAYEPVIASDDAPFRPHTAIPHRGIDLGSRLVHASTGSAAYYVPGTYVYPLYRGGVLKGGGAVAVTLRDESGGRAPLRGTRTYPLLQEISLSEAGFVLRIHIAYEHAGARQGDGEDVPLDGRTPIGALEPFDESGPTGGWATSDRVLAEAGILKGNHVHVGMGGVYRSFNGTPADAVTKLRWYRERLVPALRKSRGPG